MALTAPPLSGEKKKFGAKVDVKKLPCLSFGH